MEQLILFTVEVAVVVAHQQHLAEPETTELVVSAAVVLVVLVRELVEMEPLEQQILVAVAAVVVQTRVALVLDGMVPLVALV